MIDGTCKICDRVKWGEWVPLQGGKWRHAECSIGSANYAEWYGKQSVADQAALGPFFHLKHTALYGRECHEHTEEVA